MNLYSYDGPVVSFGTCIMNNWKASTYAVSESKARSNLTYQFKKKHNKTASAKVDLPGKVMKVG